MPSEAKDGPSGRDACAAAIAAAGKPLTANEIASAVVEAGVCPGLKGKTPKATLAAHITGGAKRGVMFKRVGSGSPAKFGLRSEVEPDPDLVQALAAKVTEVVARQRKDKGEPTRSTARRSGRSTAKRRPAARKKEKA